MRKEFGVSNRNGDSWRFQPKMKEAPSNEGAFLVPATPPPRNHTQVGYFKGTGIGSRSGKSYRSVLCDRVAASIKMNRRESTSKGFHL